jgi:hypothetical protein
MELFEHPEVNFREMDRALAPLYHFYLLEQILQRDVSNALHLSWCWLRAKEIVDSLCDGLRRTPGKQDVLEVLLASYQGLDRKMKSSGVFHLYAVLWPVPAEGMELRVLAASELETLVNKQWHMWQRHHDVIALPAEVRLLLRSDAHIHLHPHLVCRR